MEIFKKYGMESLTTEMATTQDDEVLIENLRLLVSQLRSITVNVTTSKDVRDLETKKVLNAISIVLSGRFGLQFKLVINSKGLLGTHTVTPPNHNILVGDVGKSFEMMQDYFKNSKVAPLTTTDVTNKDDSFYNTIYQNYKNLKKHMETGNIIIDLKGARITNLPSNVVAFIYLNPSLLFSTEYDLTDRELVACILHEVGHNFTSISNSYKHVTNTVTVLDAIQETVRVKHGSPLDAIKLSYKNLTGTELKANNIISATIALKSKYLLVSMNDDDNFVLTTTESESLADQFTSRFLLGGDLATALKKLGGVDREALNVEKAYLSFKENMIINSVIMIVLVRFLGPVVLVFALILLVTSIGDLRKFNTGNRIYEKYSRRILKIKQDATRQLRILKESDSCPEQTITKLVTIIESVDNLLNLHKDNKTLITKLVEQFEFNKDSNNLITFNDTVTSLMENDLYHINEKIK